MSEVLLALKEARETLNRLLAQYPATGITARRSELNKDLKHIQNQITILENFLDPFTVAELENQEVENG
jgi:ABC-type phosphate transport system auxiliary subunit|tara:strand:+ start:1300 stop:1506 length:207 start_codon:yes stop_codon:yes gene_type:complete